MIDVDCAAERVLAVQRALRTAQHLDPLDVDQRIVQIGRVRLVDAVDENADARLNRLTSVVTDAADRDEDAAGAVAVDVEARRQLGDVLDRLKPRRSMTSPLTAVTATGTFCSRFLALTGGDDDRLVAARPSLRKPSPQPARAGSPQRPSCGRFRGERRRCDTQGQFRPEGPAERRIIISLPKRSSRTCRPSMVGR